MGPVNQAQAKRRESGQHRGASTKQRHISVQSAWALSRADPAACVGCDTAENSMGNGPKMVSTPLPYALGEHQVLRVRAEQVGRERRAHPGLVENQAVRGQHRLHPRDLINRLCHHVIA